MSESLNESPNPEPDARPSDERVKKLWLDYKSNPSKELRDVLFQMYEYIPRTIAYQYLRKKPHVLDMDDLIQAGKMGLWQAMERYDPSKGVKFNTFATIRVRGSILDQINKVDWTPRPIRESIKKVIHAIEQSGTGHSISDEETYDTKLLAGLIEDMNEEDVARALVQMRKTYISHIDKNAMASIDLNVVGSREDHSTLHIIMNTVLDIREQEVIQMKFFGGYKDYEIVKYLGITQHQLNQIEKKALEKLARNLPKDLI